MSRYYRQVRKSRQLSERDLYYQTSPKLFDS